MMKMNTLEYAEGELKRYLNMLMKGTVSESFKAAFAVDTQPPLSLPDNRVWDAALDDHYSYEMTAEGGWVRGSNPRSVLLGVYAYLYALGFRFLRPGAAYDSVPDSVEGTAWLQTASHTYPFRHRGVCLEGASSLENITDFIKWMPKLGFNSFFIQFQLPYTFMERWYHHRNNPLLEQEPFDGKIAKALSAQIDKVMSLSGLIHHRVGHGWTSETAGYPSDSWETWEGEGNTSYLAMIDGERKLFHGIPLNTNLCYSSPEVIRIFSEKVVSYAKIHSEVDYLHVWLADDHNNICECEECRKALPSDQYLHILNEIDRRLTEEGLKTHIVFLLYQELLWPPQKEQLKNPARFTLMFAPISRSFNLSYPDCLPKGEISAYERNHITMPVDLLENLAHLSAWSTSFAGDSFDYDYPLGRAHYGDFGYMGIARTIYNDIGQLKKLGLNGYISCQQLRTFFPNALPDYVMGMRLSGCKMEFEEIAEDYFSHAYGAGAGRVGEYLKTLSALSDCDYFNGKGPRISEEERVKMEGVQTAVRAFREEFSSFTPTGSVEEAFYGILAYHGTVCEGLAQCIAYLSGGEEEKAAEAWEAWKLFISGQEEKFQSWLDVFRIIEVSGNYTGFNKIQRLGDRDDIKKQA